MTLRSLHFRFARWTIAVAIIFALALSIVPIHFQAQPAYASSCTSPTLHYYPGSPVSHVRYGEVDFHFFVCSSASPSSWVATVSRASVNATGKNLGFYLDSTSIYRTGGGGYYNFYNGDINWSSCVPFVGWPCQTSERIRIEFYVYVYNNVPHVMELSEDYKPLDISLFTTP